MWENQYGSLHALVLTSVFGCFGWLVLGVLRVCLGSGICLVVLWRVFRGLFWLVGWFWVLFVWVLVFSEGGTGRKIRGFTRSLEELK